MPTQADKGLAFRALHQRAGAFIIPNPWDVGTARLLERFGFEALATTSAGFAFSRGQPDGTLDREQMMSHIATIAGATDLPLSADLENGFGDSPEAAAAAVRLAAASGAVGGSIEDASRDPDHRIYDFGLAVERVRAAAEAARSLPFPFTLTARAENYLLGRPDLNDTVRRLQAFQLAGADVLYAPGLNRPEDIVTVVSAVDRPVNVVMGLKDVHLDLAALSSLGVKRVSVGSALSRLAFGAFVTAAREMRERGSFQFAQEAIPFTQISSLFASR